MVMVCFSGMFEHEPSRFRASRREETRRFTNAGQFGGKHVEPSVRYRKIIREGTCMHEFVARLVRGRCWLS